MYSSGPARYPHLPCPRSSHHLAARQIKGLKRFYKVAEVVPSSDTDGVRSIDSCSGVVSRAASVSCTGGRRVESDVSCPLPSRFSVLTPCVSPVSTNSQPIQCYDVTLDGRTLKTPAQNSFNVRVRIRISPSTPHVPRILLVHGTVMLVARQKGSLSSASPHA